MLALNPGDRPQIIGEIPAHIELPLAEASRVVRISYETFIHIVQSRLNQGDEQITLVLSRIAEVVAAPSHVGRRTADRRRVELYRHHAGDACGLLVSVKCLSGQTWVNTAFPVGARTLRKYLGSGRLAPVPEANLSLFDER